MTKIKSIAISIILSAIMIITISLSALAVDNQEYEFTNDQPSASQMFGGVFIDEGTVTVTVQKIAVSSKTDIYFTVQNNTYGTASFHMTKPTMIVNGNQISTTTFAVGSEVASFASRSFIYSFDIKLEKDMIFDLTMSIYVAKGGLSQMITVEGIDLSKSNDSSKNTDNTTSQNSQSTGSSSSIQMQNGYEEQAGQLDAEYEDRARQNIEAFEDQANKNRAAFEEEATQNSEDFKERASQMQAENEEQVRQNKEDHQERVSQNKEDFQERASQNHEDFQERASQNHEEFEERIRQMQEGSEEGIKQNNWGYTLLIIVAVIIGAAIILLICYSIRSIRNNKKAQQTFGPVPPEEDAYQQPFESAPPEEDANQQPFESAPPEEDANQQASSRFSPAQGLTQFFDNQYFMTEAECIDTVNQWFANNTQIGNAACSFDIGSRLGLLVNKSSIGSITIKYDILHEQNKYQYAIVQLAKWGLIATRADELLAQWQSHNPNITVLSSSNTLHQRGHVLSLVLGGIGAVNLTQLYLFVRFTRNPPP